MLHTNASARTLSIDIGGSGIKVMVLDKSGAPLSERVRLDTPQPATPEAVLNTIKQLVMSVGEFERISAGFPGVVRMGVIETAANLHPDWIGYNLATELSKRLQKATRVINDADMQGLGAISGQGVELVITLGTGFGSALFVDGKLVPNLEMAHHRFRKGETYEEQLGRAALEKVGEQKWNKRLQKAINSLQKLFNYDFLYIGGGEAKLVKLPLAQNIKIISNLNGLLGGIALWKDLEAL
ncbi:MAG: ROK family protein [Calothrix sp. C42_A2020_038]|nr:ROK family protein [Calothrix sp. C42_A2020_038]